MKRSMLVLAMVACAAAAGAATPEGKGSLNLGVQVGQASTPESGFGGYYVADPSYGLSLAGDMPVWSGIALGADLRASNAPYTLVSGGPHDSENIAAYGLDADLRFHLAAFSGRAYKPGDGANADGWLWWPSLSLHYGWAKKNDFNVGWIIAPVVTENDVYATDQELGYQVDLPVQAWLSVRAGYLRNTEEDLNYTSVIGPTAKVQIGGAYEAESLGLSGYINVAPGAGADADRPFLPHLGRLGQLKVSFDWQRHLDLSLLFNRPMVTQSFRLGVGAPLTQSLGLGLTAIHTESDEPVGGLPVSPFFGGSGSPNENRDTWQYGLNLSWAFGSAESRVDQ
jgi:hypothetical protein